MHRGQSPLYVTAVTTSSIAWDEEGITRNILTMLQLAGHQQHIFGAPRGVLCPAYPLLNLLPSPQCDVVCDIHTVDIPLSTLMKPGCGQDNHGTFFIACSSRRRE